MKTLKQIGILLAVSISFTVQLNSCKKDNTELKTNNGKVVDAVSQQPVANAYVALFKSNGNILNSSSSLVASTYTDANGNFSFDESLYGDEVQGTKTQYYDSKRYAFADSWYKQNKKIEIIPEAYFNLRVKNVSGLFYTMDFHAAKNDKMISLSGKDIDTLITGIGVSATAKKLSYWLTSADSGYIVYVDVQLIPFDTIDVVINY